MCDLKTEMKQCYKWEFYCQNGKNALFSCTECNIKKLHIVTKHAKDIFNCVGEAICIFDFIWANSIWWYIGGKLGFARKTINQQFSEEHARVHSTCTRACVFHILSEWTLQLVTLSYTKKEIKLPCIIWHKQAVSYP